MPTLILTDTQQAGLTLDPRDRRGNPAALDGPPAWASSDENILTVTPSPDGLAAVIAAVGPLGAAQVSASADAKLGEGVTTIVGVLDVTVVSGEAVTLGIQAGAPTES